MRKSYLEDDDEIPDGYSVKVPVVLMDSVQRQFVGHRPGFAELTNDQQQQRARTRATYLQQLSDAWRGPADGGKKAKKRTMRLFADATDAEQLCRDAYDSYVKRISNAWRDQDTPEADDDPDDLMKRHLSTEPDADNQARRDAAYSAYKDRLSNAWRTDPRAATAVERQAERWRGGR